MDQLVASTQSVEADAARAVINAARAVINTVKLSDSLVFADPLRSAS
jgi:hypothetical protein